MGASPAGPRRAQVRICLDPAGDIALTRAIHDRFRLADGHLVLTPGPGAAGPQDLIREILIRLSVLWRLPPRLRCGRTALEGDDRAAAEWEISWALSRAGITDLWVLHAGTATAPAWRWLRGAADREGLRLTLHCTAAPGAYQAAALSGCRVRPLDPCALLPAGPARPWWDGAESG